MSDSEKDKADPILEQLTPDEQRVLSRALKQIERDLLERTVKTIRNWVMLIAGVLTVFGLISLVSIKSAVVDGAATRLSQDSELKDKVIKESASNFESATTLIERAQKLSDELDRESARVSAGITTQLDDLHSMIDRIRKELENAASANKEPSS